MSVNGESARGSSSEVDNRNWVDTDLECAYRYQDPKSRLYEVTLDRYEAENAVGGDFDLILVHLSGGIIDRIVENVEPAREFFASNALRDIDFYMQALTEDVGLGQFFGTNENASRPIEERAAEGTDSKLNHPDQPEDGMGLAYRFIDPTTGAYCWDADESKVDSISEGDYQTVWVLYKRGQIDRAVTPHEYQEELEVRIGERISEGLNPMQLNEFDLISEQEATRWLERNRPDYHGIVERTIEEMGRGIVLYPDDEDPTVPSL